MSDVDHSLSEPPPTRRRNRRVHRFLALMQVVPLLMVFLLVTACSGTGGGGDFFTSRRSNIFLKGFVARVGNSNTPDPVPVSAWAPFAGVAGGVNSNSGGRSTDVVTDETPITNADEQPGIRLRDLLFDDVFAQLNITNGISARLDQILIEFTEVDGSPVMDFNASPPISLPGAFDYPIRLSMSIIANPITSIPSELTEPSGNTSRFFIPINIFKSGIYEFLVRQPRANHRPFLCRMTFSGRDILDNPFRIVSFLMLSPVLQTTERTLPTGGGGTDRAGPDPGP